MPAPEVIHRLVEKFNSQFEVYKSNSYTEHNVRVEFVDPLFKALHWDVHNEDANAEAYKDVIHEPALKTSTGSKNPDYCFRIGGTAKFFLETKKPSVDIKDNRDSALQVRRYGWSGKLSISILTDFEEFSVYDCRIKPKQNDDAHVARILYYTYKDYLEKWDEIYGLFSKRAILNGSFDKFIKTDSKKKGTTTVDQAFLEDMESWRDLLARNIALRNRDLSSKELNHLVQATIDRIVFLRICEDRNIEPYGQLQKLLKHGDIYKNLYRLFVKADDKYNSGLFHFKKEKGREEADRRSSELKLDDKILYEIIDDLYYPKSPYVFSQIPAEILGQVYEQFLGKVIRLTPNHQAKVELKPDVRKAGGVYYTPKYIVDYIVKNTVGELLKNKSPAQAKKLKFLDPACGSGSFLLGAYQFLLQWYLTAYAKDPTKHKKLIYQVGGNEWRLSTQEKKDILLKNIYGVDIDRQAVEVTKLSLLLKVLEGESQDRLDEQWRLFAERALPDLGNNIKCGNSLIGTDFLFGKNLELFGKEDVEKINPFDWEDGFPEIMKAGGFDAVIGNPPYVRIQSMNGEAFSKVQYFKTKYKTAIKGNYDLYIVFVEKGLQLLNQSGLLCLIIPNKFLTTDYGFELRNLISSQKSLRKLLSFEHAQVFESATIYTCVILLSRRQNNFFLYAKSNDLSDISSFNFSKIESTKVTNNSWVFYNKDSAKIIEKISLNSTELILLPTKISRGSSTGDDSVFILKRDGKNYRTKSGELVELENGILRSPLFATNFDRYYFKGNSADVIIFPYYVKNDNYSLLSEFDLKDYFPKTYNYLQNNKKSLLKRKQFKQWFGFSAPRNLSDHDKAHLLVPLLANKGLYSTIYSNSKYCLMASGGFSLYFQHNNGMSINYIWGLLNSKLLFWKLKQISNIFRGGWVTCTKQYVQTMPIKSINLSNPTQKTQHDRMVALVDQMLDTQKRLQAARSEIERKPYQQMADALDKQIDALVYELYEITPEEIKIVEGVE